jgi:dTDP-4-dehydrorhamnose reductase
VYGQSKAAAEAMVLRIAPSALVIRTSAFFGPWDEANLVTRGLRALHANEHVALPDDLVLTPTYVPDLAHAVLDLLLDGERGIWHLTNETATTWFECVHCAARRLSIGTDALEPRGWRTLGLAAARPAMSALESERGWLLPSLDSALDRYVEAVAARGIASPLVTPAT